MALARVASRVLEWNTTIQMEPHKPHPDRDDTISGDRQCRAIMDVSEQMQSSSNYRMLSQ